MSIPSSDTPDLTGCALLLLLCSSLGSSTQKQRFTAARTLSPFRVEVPAPSVAMFNVAAESADNEKLSRLARPVYCVYSAFP